MNRFPCHYRSTAAGLGTGGGVRVLFRFFSFGTRCAVHDGNGIGKTTQKKTLNKKKKTKETSPMQMASGACFFLTIFASFFFCIESASLFFVLPWPPANGQLTHADRKLEKLFFFLSFFLILSLIGYQRNRPPIHPAANKRRSADWIARLGRGTRASRRFDSIGKKSKILFKNNSAPFSFRKPTIRFVFRIAA